MSTAQLLLSFKDCCCKNELNNINQSSSSPHPLFSQSKWISFVHRASYSVSRRKLISYTFATATSSVLSLSSSAPASSNALDDTNHRGFRVKSDEEKRPRFFDSNAKSLCWDKAATIQGRHPDRWRKDIAGNVVCKRLRNCEGCLCYEYDHIIPFSKGGPSMTDNCQILQTRVNKFKSNKDDVSITQLKGYSCDVRFTDKELDIIEMAVYGDVLRLGKQCRVGTVGDIPTTRYKSKDRLRTCKLR